MKRRPGPKGPPICVGTEALERAHEALEGPTLAEFGDPRLDTEKTLGMRVRTCGDIRARDELVKRNLRLVPYLTRGLVPPNLLEEACQEGMLGLIRSTETFDERRDVKFGTYAGLWIRAFVTRFRERHEKAEHLPIVGQKAQHRLRPKRLDDVLYQTWSGEDDMALHEIIRSHEPTPEDVCLRNESDRLTLAAIDQACLTHEEASLIHDRLLADEPKTFQQLGEEQNLSREWIRQKELKVIRRLRQTCPMGI